MERWLSMFGAGAFVTCGLTRGSLPLLALGAGLAYRAYSGHCHMYEALGHSTADQNSQESREGSSRIIIRE
jgi:uncharacterized membrane protein